MPYLAGCPRPCGKSRFTSFKRLFTEHRIGRDLEHLLLIRGPTVTARVGVVDLTLAYPLHVCISAVANARRAGRVTVVVERPPKDV